MFSPFSDNARPRRGFGRRRFLELAGTAGAAAVLTTGLNLTVTKVPSLFASGNIEALVLNCMDFRLVNEVGFLLNEHGLVNKYDQMILAGATLGVATDKYPAWAETYWNHLDLAMKLHGIQRVIAVDHRDCGAYKLVFGKDFGKLPDEETEIHTKVMTDFQEMMKKKQPNLEVELLLMSLDGHVEPIGGEATTKPAPSGGH
ncbi:MAG: carbonic anhydrase [Chloroflexota bacterium]